MAPLEEPAGCSWPISYSACSSCSALTDLDADQQLFFEEMAVDYLRAWTSNQFGLCQVSVRPCREECWEGRSTFYGSGPYPRSLTPAAAQYGPVLIQGARFNISCGTCGDKCSCSYTPSLELPGPVDSIEAVTINGMTLDPAAYKVQNRALLVRTDGGDWPTCQDMAAAPTDQYAETFQITYTRGTPVPAGGQLAAGILACEFAKASCNDKTCQLPQRLQSISRQGVELAVLDTFDDIDAGHTGIWLVDNWVASVTKPRAASSVRSVDLPRFSPRVDTWPVR